MRIEARAAAVMAFAAAAGAPPIAQAHPGPAPVYYQFQSPWGNIFCDMDDVTGTPIAQCEIVDYTYPTLPQSCPQGVGGRFELNQGSPAALVCHSDTVRAPDAPTFDYGQSKSLAALTCDSEPSGMTCTDTGTGHFFRVARDSYELH